MKFLDIFRENPVIKTVIGCRIQIGVCVLFAGIFLSSCSPVEKELHSDLRLWYSQPAGDDWMKALPIGNGRLGGMVFGGVAKERIMLNESSVWYRDDNDREDSFQALQKARALLCMRTFLTSARLFKSMETLAIHREWPKCLFKAITTR